jgi:hypothetical protein
MEKSTEPQINLILNNMLSKLLKFVDLKKIKNFKNVQSIKLIFSQISKSISISLSTLICLKHQTIFTSFMNIVTVAL